VAFNLILQSHSRGSFFDGTWQKRPRERDWRLRFEYEEMTLQMYKIHTQQRHSKCTESTKKIMYKIYTQQMYKIRTQQRHFQIKKSTNKKRYKIHAQQIYEIHTQQRHSKCTKSDTPNVQNPHTIEARNSFFYVHIVFSVTFEICMYNTYTYSYTYVYMRVHTPHTTESNIHVVWIHILLLH